MPLHVNAVAFSARAGLVMDAASTDPDGQEIDLLDGGQAIDTSPPSDVAQACA